MKEDETQRDRWRRGRENEIDERKNESGEGGREGGAGADEVTGPDGRRLKTKWKNADENLIKRTKNWKDKEIRRGKRKGRG